MLEIILWLVALMLLAAFVWGIIFFLPDYMPWNKHKDKYERWWDDDHDDRSDR